MFDFEPNFDANSMEYELNHFMNELSQRYCCHSCYSSLLNDEAEIVCFWTWKRKLYSDGRLAKSNCTDLESFFLLRIAIFFLEILLSIRMNEWISLLKRRIFSLKYPISYFCEFFAPSIVQFFKMLHILKQSIYVDVLL